MPKQVVVVIDETVGMSGAAIDLHLWWERPEMRLPVRWRHRS